MRKKPETAPSTYRFYHDKAQRFVNWLGSRADQQIAVITRDDILAFRAVELERVASRSVNHSIKFLRVVFKTAKEDGKYHDENPASGVKVAKLRDASRRRSFTIPEIKRILKIANDEWKSLIYLGLYTGQRLGDLARLTWQNLDLDRDEIRFVSRKTGANNDYSNCPAAAGRNRNIARWRQSAPAASSARVCVRGKKRRS